MTLHVVQKSRKLGGSPVIRISPDGLWVSDEALALIGAKQKRSARQKLEVLLNREHFIVAIRVEQEANGYVPCRSGHGVRLRSRRFLRKIFGKSIPSRVYIAKSFGDGVVGFSIEDDFTERRHAS